MVDVAVVLGVVLAESGRVVMLGKRSGWMLFVVVTKRIPEKLVLGMRFT